MRRGRTIAWAAGLIAMLMAAAYAAELRLSILGRHELACPVCQQRFTTVSCTQTNTRGGVDRDLFTRAVGPEPEYYRISTCPHCGYSGYLSDFDPNATLAPDLRDRILREPRLKLPEGFTPDSDPRELDAKDRYRLAIQCYRWSQKSDEALGWLHLRASWIARDEGAILPKDSRLARVLEFAEQWRPDLGDKANQLDVEMQLVTRMGEELARGRFNRYQRPYVELAIALILRRHGENRQVLPMLERLSKYEPFGDVLLKSIERMRASIAEERACQVEAVNCFERALLAKRITAGNVGTAQYLMGELCRRLGRDDDAAGWYARAQSDPSTPLEVRTWAQDVLNDAKR